MQTTSVHFTFNFFIKMLGKNMQERIKLAYTVALFHVPRLLTLNTILQHDSPNLLNLWHGHDTSKSKSDHQNQRFYFFFSRLSDTALRFVKFHILLSNVFKIINHDQPKYGQYNCKNIPYHLSKVKTALLTD